MKNFTIQIPYDESIEWVNALPLISHKKCLELNKKMRQLTKKNGWNLMGFKNGLLIFRREGKEVFWQKGHVRRKTFFYLALDIETNTTVSVNDGDDFEHITVLKEVKKFLDPVSNRFMYSNMAPWSVIRFYGVQDGVCTTRQASFAFDGD